MNRIGLASLILIVVLLVACGTLPEPLPTPAPTTTPDAYQLTLVNVQAQATLDAAQSTASAIQASKTGTAYAPTQQAIETATERAWTMAGWTATASVEQTAMAINSTATAQAWTPTPNFTATVEAAAASAQATALHGQAVSVELAVERERMMNKVQAVAPWGGLMVAFVFVLVMAFRWSKVRPVQRDARGDAPLLIIDGKVYDADRNPYPLVDLSGKKPQIPALTAPEMQIATTARDQMIDLATRGGQGQASPQRKAIAEKMAAQNILPQAAQVRVLPPEQARPLLGDVIPGIVRDAIETDLNEPGENHD
ncbi:MAG: hypothetical protein L6461_14700 [Anaerolineae bacterium]|nr:hypothetical protein [Anaerolineae bacterium]